MKSSRVQPLARGHVVVARARPAGIGRHEAGARRAARRRRRRSRGWPGAGSPDRRGAALRCSTMKSSTSGRSLYRDDLGILDQDRHLDLHRQTPSRRPVYVAGSRSLTKKPANFRPIGRVDHSTREAPRLRRGAKRGGFGGPGRGPRYKLAGISGLTCSAAQPRVERVAQGVAEQVGAEHGQADGEPGKSTSHGAFCAYSAAETESMRPHDG